MLELLILLLIGVWLLDWDGLLAVLFLGVCFMMQSAAPVIHHTQGMLP